MYKDARPPGGAERRDSLVKVLHYVWTYEVTTRCDFARKFADEIAEGASRGLLTTTIIPKGEKHGRLWKLTPEGGTYLFANVEALTQEEVDYVEAHCAR